DDCERAHIGIELLTRAREQALEQCIEAQVPANAVVNERAEQAALLARRLIVDHQCGVERASAQRHVRNDLRRGGANCSRTAHDPSTAPSRRCALRNSAADSALRPARCTRVRRSTPLPVLTSIPTALVASTSPGLRDARESMGMACHTRNC